MINHLWQSTIFALAAAILTLAFRRNRAQVRYWLWLSASVKFLIPFSLLMMIGSRVPAARGIATPVVATAIVQVTEPFPETVAIAPSAPHDRDWAPAAMLAIWVCGLAAIATIRVRGWLRVHAALRASAPVDIRAAVETRSTPGLLEPGVVGLFRAILLVPEGIAERLTPRQLEAVLAHELCHVRRRDNLTSAVHMIVEALFWFHPLVWWIGARLVEERERACDEAVLSLGGEPHDYAEAILNVCKLYVESPLVCVSGVTGSDLRKRIEAIMTNRLVLRLNFAKKVALAGAGMVAIASPVVIGMMNLPRLRGQAPTPKFEVASIRLCNSTDNGGRGKAKGGGDSQGPSPDRLTLVCQPVKSLIRTAYLTFANGRRIMPGRTPPIDGGPGWIDSDRYRITAKAEGTPGQDTMRGPMLQTLLEDRFKLKVHRETREVPVYALTVTKNGPKLKPFEEGSCQILDFSKPPAPVPGERLPLLCGLAWRKTGPSGVSWELHGATLDDFAVALGGDLDRIVVNKTGISGKFDYHLEFTADQTTAGLNSLRVRGGEPAFPPPADPSGGLSVFTAIQEQLGLKLESAKGPREFLVVDHVERPTEN